MLKSIENQTFKEFKLHIINNGSTDETNFFLSNIYNKDFKYINRKKNNRDVFKIAAQYNDLKYTIVLHDDDVLMPKFFDECVKALEMNKSIKLITTKISLIDQNGKDLNQIRPKIFFKRYWKKNQYLRLYSKRGNILPFPALMYRSEILDKINLNFDYDSVGPAGDLYIIFQIDKLEGQIRIINKNLFKYRIHSNQDSYKNKIISEFMLRPHVLDLLVNKRENKLYENASLGFILNILIYEKLTKKIDKMTFKYYYDELKKLGLKFNFYSVYWLLFSILRFLKKSI